MQLKLEALLLYMHLQLGKSPFKTQAPLDPLTMHLLSLLPTNFPLAPPQDQETLHGPSCPGLPSETCNQETSMSLLCPPKMHGLHAELVP